jgi:rhamnogalacturonyl hydrolase YesR
MNDIIDTTRMIEESLLKVERWVEEHDYKSYEPFDGLNSVLRPLTFGNVFAERLLQQLVRQSPINLRPLLGVRPDESTKGRGYMAWGYVLRLKVTANQTYAAKAAKCLEWLIENRAPGHSDYSWGNHFDFSSRVGRIPKLEPIIPWSSLIGQAFLDAYEIFGRKEYLEIAISICDWILKVPRRRTESGTCLGYNVLGESTVHGASMLGAALLARTARVTGDRSDLQVAREAMEYSCTRQNPDGSWFYAEEANSKWIDNFHTGYNLDSLKCYIDNTNDKTYEDHLKRGLTYFKNTFFEKNGRPKYYHNRVYPVDIQCASQAIDTLAYLSGNDETCLELATKVARWTIVNMQDKTGYFYYRQLPYMKVKTPMLHWGQATMYKALSHLLSRMDVVSKANTRFA